MKTLLASLAVLAVLAANVAHAGPLAPAPRVIAKYERNFIERSGAQTLQEMLDTGIVRYFLTGGQPLLVLVNGRPYSTTAGDLDALPLSAIERIELISGETLGTLGGSAVRGALNIVLRTDLDGFEVRALARMPTREGGDGRQGSVFWGGAVGDGRMTVGADVIRREEITARSRDYSRSEWMPGGTFSDTKNVSLSGNTVYVVPLDEDSERTGPTRSVSLGDCDPAHGYTGPLVNPPGIGTGDLGCGFAYGNIMWNSARFDQENAILNLEHPVGEGADLHVDGIFTRGAWAFRYAPSVDVFSITPDADLRSKINDAAGSAFEADGDDRFAVGHRFVGHGNRDWRGEYDEFDVSATLQGRLAEDLGYDARIEAHRLDGFTDGDTFVHADRIKEEIREGRYDLANPFSTADAHTEAVEKTGLRLEHDIGSDYLGTRLALEGSGFPVGGRDAAWTAGVELGRVKAHSIRKYRSNDGMTHEVHQVLGSGGTSYSGERKAAAAFAEMSLPVAENLDLRVAGRGDEFDDVGGLESWRLGADYRANDVVTLRGSWSAGQRSPSFGNLYSDAVQDHPYVVCDPGSGPPPRTCTQFNNRQVTRVTKGNPELDPWDSERLAIGADARRGPFFLGVEWYRLSRYGLPGQNTAHWAMLNLPVCAGGDTTNCIERTGGDITIHDGYRNIEDAETSGFNVRVGGGRRTDWGVVGMRGTWRRINTADRRIAGEEVRYAIPSNVVRIGFLARRGNLSAVWTTSYRSGFENTARTGTFESWTGHDVVLDWAEPLGLEDARFTAGVFNLTDAGLSVDTSNPHSVDGPTEAGWGRTFFVTLNVRF